MSDRIKQIANQLNYPKGLLASQVAIITGSSQGIGAECARLFVNEGSRVIVSDIDAAKASHVADKIRGNGGEAVAVPGDLLRDEYIKELFGKAAEFGGGKIHTIVNNAGFTWDAVIHKMTDKHWETIVALHATVPFKLVREAAPYFRTKDGEPRNILKISSTSGLHGNASQINYAIAKAGGVGLTKTIAKEWGPGFGVRANTVAFGHIETRLTANKEAGTFVKKQKAGGVVPYIDIPLRRPGSATEAASTILAIASPFSSHISGQTISVAGGRNM
ncbi:hypothetical protein B0T26DRAFT_741065 [Lasiosphaeria miniovina]|uniref:3-oxoacyl-[acyl-carrier-protein] reductase n=1 Tax=Lasiosphaeria miniovina TaxID=1954250 RepID=A0AA40DW72_9PEZI|nr:uncharacterized protein B0T26DRAFT_741065 [Lasiosphaeria miniovina]KAK0717905.1 hypothetical protein B0T26DRAFT_741065 [Lasiosphaeria miniovina]